MWISIPVWSMSASGFRATCTRLSLPFRVSPDGARTGLRRLRRAAASCVPPTVLLLRERNTSRLTSADKKACRFRDEIKDEKKNRRPLPPEGLGEAGFFAVYRGRSLCWKYAGQLSIFDVVNVFNSLQEIYASVCRV